MIENILQYELPFIQRFAYYNTLITVGKSKFMNESMVLRQLGLRIKKIRISKNITQYNLAMQCNFEKSSMSRIETGKSNITLRSLCKIANALGVEVVELLEE